MDQIYGHRPASQGREAGLDSATALLESLVEGDGGSESRGEDFTSPGPSSVEGRCCTPSLPTPSPASPPASPPRPGVGNVSLQQRPGRRRREQQHHHLTELLREMQASDEREAHLNREFQRQQMEQRERTRLEELRARQEERQEERRQLAQQSQLFHETFLQGVALLAQALRAQRGTGPNE